MPRIVVAFSGHGVVSALANTTDYDVYSPMKAENTQLKKQNGQKADRLTKTTDVKRQLD